MSGSLNSAEFDRAVARGHARGDCGCAACARFPGEKVPPAVVLDYQRWRTTGKPPAAKNKETEMAKKKGSSRNGKSDTSPPFERDLECRLKASELQAKKDRALAALDEADEKKEELNKISLPIKNTIKALKAESKKLREEAHRGTEVRKVNCVSHLDFQRNRVRVIRQDTREVIEDRAMSSEERQEELGMPEVPARRGRAAGEEPSGEAAEVQDD